ncbi:MAG TPA: hypothetical protein VKS60_19775 [Stellaceae bacterium]|nr:hypothetical protein [Stellaceae bacterium]
MRPILAALLSVAAVLTAMPAAGARFPNAVEMSVTLTGEDIRDAAALLGVTGPDAKPLTLRLGRGDAWAVYLLKHDTPEELYNDEHMPPRFDTASFAATPVPSLTLGPFWLDLGTALPNPRVGEFSFGSPFLPEALDGDDPWTRLLRRLKAEPGWAAGAAPRIRHCHAADGGAQLCIEAYAVKDYTDNVERDGYGVGLILRKGR